MKLYSFPEKRIWKILFGAYLFALLLLARNGMVSCVLLGLYKAQILMLLVIGAGVLTFAIVNRRELKHIFLDRRMLAAAACAGLILLPMAVKRDWQLMYFSMLLCRFSDLFRKHEGCGKVLYSDSVRPFFVRGSRHLCASAAAGQRHSFRSHVYQ